MKSYSNRYKCLNKYMVRTPLLPVDMYLNIDKEKRDKIDFFKESSEIQEAIITTSISLYNSIVKTNKREKSIEQVESALLKYMIRMSTRTTPYGLLSSVGLGEFGDKTKIHSNNLSKCIKFMRVDMEWILNLLYKIENDEEILKELRVFKNNSLKENGNRLENIYLSNYGKGDIENYKFNASIIYSEKVKETLHMNEGGMKVKDLIKILNPENKYDNNNIFVFLKKLIKNEYLLTELRPPLINSNTMDYIVNKLKYIEPAKTIYKDIKDIQIDINRYNDTKIGYGQDMYFNILSKMERLCKSKNYLQIDLKSSEKVCTLNENIKKDIETVVEVLLKLSQDYYQPIHLEQFANEFIEKYGTYREVKMLEVLDSSKGIGYPSGYASSNKIITNRNESSRISEFRYKQIIYKKLNDVINKRSENIYLLDEDLDYICGESKKNWNKDNIPNSLDLNVFIKSKNLESVDKGKYELFIGPNYGSPFAGKMFGRFAYMFENHLSSIFTQIDKAIKDINKDAILVEITQLPKYGRSSNVCKNFNERDYEFCIATNKSESCKKINIEDIYIGVNEHNKIYFKSKRINKKILFTSNHMLNNLSGDNMYRFIREVSEQSNLDIFSGIYDSQIHDLVSIPRIMYKNIVIIPAMWKINKDLIKGRNNNKKEIILEIKKTIKENNIPKYVYIGNNDNRIVIDTNNEDHLNELLKMIYKSDEYTYLKELDFYIENAWFKDKGGKKYISEFVFPLVLKKDYEDKVYDRQIIETKSDISKNKCLIETYSENRVNGLFEDWIYFKIYISQNRVEEFLSYDLMNLSNGLIKKNIIDKIFYIKYGDPKFHIRFRVKLKNSNQLLELLKIMNGFIKEEIKKGIVSDVKVDTYFKEIERYGGEHLINIAEDVFYVDSLVCMKLINLIEEKQCDLDYITIACINIVQIMESMGISFDQQNILFQSIYDQKKERDLFRKKYKELKNYCNDYNDWEKLKQVKGGDIVYKIIKDRKEIMKIYWESMNEEDRMGNLTNSKVNILLSIIHMFCNRFLKNRKDEELVMCLVRHTLHSLEYTKKIKKEEYNDK